MKYKWAVYNIYECKTNEDQKKLLEDIAKEHHINLKNDQEEIDFYQDIIKLNKEILNKDVLIQIEKDFNRKIETYKKK